MRNAILALLLIGCGTNDLTLHYKLDGIAPSDVVRVETRVDIADSDSRSFYVDQPFRQVAQGIGYEVRDDDGDGKRTLMITHDATLGYVFTPTFDFRLLPPVSESAPPLTITARAVGVSDMIGQTMALSAKFSTDATLAVDLTDARCGGQFCDPNQACCSSACTDVQSDVTNCGGCNVGCAPGGDSCSGSTCRCAGGSACAAGNNCCAGVGCVDLQTDAFHCGDCNHACNAGESCVGGVCKCGSGAACAAGTACCGNGCAGAQGCPCGTNTFCTSTQICCGTTCVDPTTNNSNCGMCGVACTTPLACAGGACACNGAVCAPTDTCCTTGCANTGNDPNNCGACGHHCRANEVCSGGQCLCGSVQCSAGQLCCGGACVTQSPMNCGTCSRVCKMGEACQQGMCTCNGGNNCTGNQVCCPAGATGGGGGCFDLSNDPNHCGDCNTQCTNGDACVLGHCMPSQCNPVCTNGNTCFSGQCACNGGPACADPSTCCTDGCKDLQNDPLNCNACGHKCNPGNYCCKGNCVKPDDNNCTGCGQGCGANGMCCTGCSPPKCAALSTLCICGA